MSATHDGVLQECSDPQRPMGIALGALCHASRTIVGAVSDLVALRLQVSETIAMCDHAVMYIPPPVDGLFKGDVRLDERIEVRPPASCACQ